MILCMQEELICISFEIGAGDCGFGVYVNFRPVVMPNFHNYNLDARQE